MNLLHHHPGKLLRRDGAETLQAAWLIRARPRGRALSLALFVAGLGYWECAAVDLSKAVIVSPASLSRPEQKAVTMLVEEVEKRTQIRWETVTAWPLRSGPVIALGQASALKDLATKQAGDWLANQEGGGAEGFRIRTQSQTNGAGPAVFVAGNDRRGVLYGVGYLLRHMQMERGTIRLPEEFSVTTAPKYRLRGHQLGYRPKTHSYDGWDLAVWEQYYRDLVVFGANAIELIPPRSDDAATSPHFPLPPLPMMVGMSKLADDYGLDVWIWFPALDRDYSDPKTVASAVEEWNRVFEKLPRLDAVFVPGGDPGHTPPRPLLAFLAKQAQSLHRTHPRAQMWVSPQGFNQPWLDEFLDLLRTEEPDWLSGIVFGPQVRMSLPELRAALPKKYPIRHYPDITHTRQCQYPVPDWDTAYAVTEGRECINPRPVDEAAIFRLLQPYTIGFLAYSEGCNDDVNKAIWSALGWDPDARVIDILREYSRYFIGERYRDDFAQGLLALERNWRGPLIANQNVEGTLEQFQQMGSKAAPRERLNWRFQEALFRAYYDAYTRSRLLYETALEDRAMNRLRQASNLGSLFALSEAEAILNRALTEPVALDRRARIFELGEALFQSIHMQMSVPRYQAIAVDRGACLDTIDYPLNNRPWLVSQFDSIRRLPSEQERLSAIDRLVNWTNPGPGGFYDDLGHLGRQPHLVRGLPFAKDPARIRSSMVGFEEWNETDEPDEKPAAPLRMSWIDHAESLHDQPLSLRYTDLDPDARYRIRVVYAGDSPEKKIRLVANDTFEIHPLIKKPWPFRPLEFDIPSEAIRSGELNLQWFGQPGLGRNGRGCQVSEVWLLKP
jgi:hypothetical protein